MGLFFNLSGTQLSFAVPSVASNEEMIGAFPKGERGYGRSGNHYQYEYWGDVYNDYNDKVYKSWVTTGVPFVYDDVRYSSFREVEDGAKVYVIGTIRPESPVNSRSWETISDFTETSLNGSYHIFNINTTNQFIPHLVQARANKDYTNKYFIFAPGDYYANTPQYLFTRELTLDFSKYEYRYYLGEGPGYNYINRGPGDIYNLRPLKITDSSIFSSRNGLRVRLQRRAKFITMVHSPIGDYIFTPTEAVQFNTSFNDGFTGNCTVTAYLDGSSTPFYSTVITPTANKTVIVSGINRSQITEGRHTIRVMAKDANYTSEITQEIFIQNAPTLQSESFSYNVSGNNFGASFKFKAVDVYTSTNINYAYAINSGAKSGNTATVSGRENSIALGSYKPATKINLLLYLTDEAGVVSSKEYISYTPPLQPTATVSSITNQSAEISINDVNGSEVQYAIMCNDKFVKPDGSLTVTETFMALPTKKITLKALDYSTNYSIKVRAKNNDPIQPRYTGYSVESKFRTLPRNLESVQNLKAIEVTNNSALIQWDAVNEAVEYKITTSDGVTSKTFITPLNRYELTQLVGNTQYFVTIQAVNSTILSPQSSPIGFKTTFFVNDLREADPVSKTTGTEIELTWTPVANAISYDIEADGTILFSGRQTEVGLAEQFIHKDLMPGTTHLYRIRARVASGYGPWSGYIRVTTKSELPQGAPIINQTESYGTYDSVVLKWSDVRSATEYEVTHISNSSIGEVFTVKGESQCILKGLNPNTSYKFQIRGINNLGQGAWSEVITISTAYLKTPRSVIVTESDNIINVAFEKVDGAENYKVDLYNKAGAIVLSKTQPTLSYTFEELNPESEYFVRIQALSEAGNSAPSEAISCFTLPKKPNKITEISAMAFEKCIYFHWNQIASDGTPETVVEGYDVEVDGVLLENGLENNYLYERLTPYTEHTFRVRARNGAVEGDWSDFKKIKTLPERPIAPSAVIVKSTSTSIALTWEQIPGNLGYDIRIDDGNGFKMYENIHSEKFIIRKTKEQQEYRIQIRTTNIHGKSDWGNLIINNGIKALCQYDKDIELGLAAVDANDLRKYEMIVTYDPNVLTVVDLCSLTGEIELKPGKVKGTNIEIIGFEEGRIKFKVDKVLNIDEAWTGVINAIKLNAKHKGGTTITYTVILTGLPELIEE